MGSAVTNVLRPLPIDEFVQLASHAGLVIRREDLEQLQHLDLIQPSASGAFGRLHLYVLSVYFETIRVFQHPWSTPPAQRSLDDVKRLAERVAQVNAATAGEETSDDAGEVVGALAVELERHIATIDPFGPIAGIIDVVRPDVLARLRGVGRLYAELRATATALAEAAEDLAPALESVGPHTVELRVETEGPVTEEDEPVADLEAAEPETEESEAENERDSEVEDESDAEDQREQDEEAAEIPAAVHDVDEDARVTAEVDQVVREDEPEPTLAVQKGFVREESSTGRTRALLDRLEQIKAQRGGPEEGPSDEKSAVESLGQHQSEPSVAEDETRPATLQEKVNELNLLREQLIRAQDWGGLVALYEQRIDLFEDPQDCQQVLLTLATLYELKLDDEENAFRCFHEAFAIDVEAGRRRTLDSLRKIGKRPRIAPLWVSWLEEHLAQCPPSLRDVMQRDLASAHAAADRGAHAFLSYAAFLAEEPDARIDSSALDFLDGLSLEVDDDELAAFYDDVLEHTEAPSVRCLVALRAGTFFLGRNVAHHAIRCFRIAFDIDSSSDIAFSNLSRLYEKEGSWKDLTAIIARKIATAEGKEAERLRRELKGVVEKQITPDEAIARFRGELEKDPNDEYALDRLVEAYAGVDRLVDAYGELNRLVDRTLSPEQEVRVRKHLAWIASEHLFAPEEAGHHFQRALELNGPEREILEGLANVRLSAGDWGAAIATLRQLTDGVLPLGGDRRRKWLNAGIEAARQAKRPDDLRHFQEMLSTSTSNAS